MCVCTLYIYILMWVDIDVLFLLNGPQRFERCVPIRRGGRGSKGRNVLKMRGIVYKYNISNVV